MFLYTPRLDSALRKAAWAHEQAGQHRKGSDIPYIIHPVGVMTIAGTATDDEDTLIACLLHDVLEDVSSEIYGEAEMHSDFGDRVVAIVKDVTKDDSHTDWRAVSNAYLSHLEHKASDEAVIVSAADKIHNLQATVIDYKQVGESLWQRFATKSSDDQIWWYESILEVIKKRQAPQILSERLADELSELKHAMAQNK